MFCLLRFLFQVGQVSFNNPIVSQIRRLTDSILKVPRAVMPHGRYVDTASLFGSWLALSISYFLEPRRREGLVEVDRTSTNWRDEMTRSMNDNLSPSLFDGILDAAWLGLTSILYYSVWAFGIAMIATIAFSWIAPASTSPYHHLARELSGPILRPIQRFLPPLGALDLSPMLAGFILITINTRIVPWLNSLVV